MNETPVPIPAIGKCANITVMTKDGKIFDLGSPDSIFFPLRRQWYLFRRRNEVNGVNNG